MKKTFIATISLVGAFLLSSCVMSDLKKVTDEINEVESGKVFLIPCAKLTYRDGTIFTFDEYGKKQRIEKGDELEIYLGTTWYSLDKSTKKGTKYTYTGSYGYFTIYCFLENSYLVEAKYDEDLKKGKETIAGQSCNIYTEGDGDKIGGYKRILFVDTNSNILATAFTTSIPENSFSTAGYDITEY